MEDARKTASGVNDRGDDGGDAKKEVVVLCNVQMFMSDYRKVGGGFNVDASRHIHREDVEWLRTKLESARR